MRRSKMLEQLATKESSEEKMRIIAWIILGLIAGALGKLIMPGDDPGGINSDDHNGHRRRPFRWFHWTAVRVP
jgi:hypothetical protein